MQTGSLEFCISLVIFIFAFCVSIEYRCLCCREDLEHVVFGIYSINVEGGDATTPLVVEVLHDLGHIATACVPLMGVIYAMNLSN